MFKKAFYQAFRNLISENPLGYQEIINKGDISKYRPYTEESIEVQKCLDEALLASFKLLQKTKNALRSKDGQKNQHFHWKLMIR